MQTENDLLPIIWENREFHSIIDFDCHVVHLQTTKEGGSYSTVIPISCYEYRKKNPTNASVKVRELKNGYTEFEISSDWRQRSIMLIPTIQKEKISFAIESAKRMGLFL